MSHEGKKFGDNFEGHSGKIRMDGLKVVSFYKLIALHPVLSLYWPIQFWDYEKTFINGLATCNVDTSGEHIPLSKYNIQKSEFHAFCIGYCRWVWSSSMVVRVFYVKNAPFIVSKLLNYYGWWTNHALRKKKISLKVINEEGFPNIWGNAQIFPHIWGGRLCNCSTLNFLIYEENLIFFFISVGQYNGTSFKLFSSVPRAPLFILDTPLVSFLEDPPPSMTTKMETINFLGKYFGPT
jgi:hypothetical protein